MESTGNFIITTDVSEVLKEAIATVSPTSVSLIVDHNTRINCLPLIEKALPAYHEICITPGEKAKNLNGASLIWEKLTENKVDRKGLAIILGGGVLGDMGGFCAATYKRGIPFVLIPTTLLSQVDASIGGKLGIDFLNFKNHVGLFKQPHTTIIDTNFLKTLPESEIRSGFAEVIKHCLIADREMWSEIKNKSLVQQDWNKLVSHSVEIKKSITNKDPEESGLRKILNFGHTIGHAIETDALNENKTMMHGEAIAIGMICESYLACQRKMISSKDLEQITTFILTIFGFRDFENRTTYLMNLMLQDKKNQNNKICFSLINGIGSCDWNIEVDQSEIICALDYYLGLNNKNNP